MEIAVAGEMILIHPEVRVDVQGSGSGDFPQVDVFYLQRRCRGEADIQEFRRVRRIKLPFVALPFPAVNVYARIQIGGETVFIVGVVDDQERRGHFDRSHFGKTEPEQRIQRGAVFDRGAVASGAEFQQIALARLEDGARQQFRALGVQDERRLRPEILAAGGHEPERGEQTEQFLRHDASFSFW